MQKPRPGRQGAVRPLIMALEPRLMFDGAAMVDFAAVADLPAFGQEQSTSIVFIDSAVEDPDALLLSHEPGAEFVRLEAGQGGLSQMTDYLAGRSGLASIQVVSHGAAGTLFLGGEAVTQASLAEHAQALKTIGASLRPGGDLLLFGCDVGAGEAGAAFLQVLSQRTGADVAASTDTTGHTALGGDWELEAETGTIEAGSALSPSALEGWKHTLDLPFVFGGTSGDDSYDMAVDSQGNLIVTGSFQGTADFDPGTGVTNLTAAGNSDIFLAKYSASGALVWAIGMGSSNSEAGYAVEVDSSDNIYVTGDISGTVDFDPGAGITNLSASSGEDAFVAKYTSAGALSWAVATNTSGDDVKGQGIAIDATGSFAYVGGYFNGSGDFDGTAGTTTLTADSSESASRNDAFLMKLSTSDGALQWAKRMGGDNGGENIQAVRVDGSGNVYVAGSFDADPDGVDFDGDGTSDLTPTAVQADGSSTNENNDFGFISKFNASGTLQWCRPFLNKGTSGADTDFNDLWVDGSGNVSGRSGPPTVRPSVGCSLRR